MNTKQLKKARESKNFTQAQVANLLKISTKTYNRKELGIIEFSCKEIRGLSKILNLTLKDVENIFLSQ